MKITCRPSAFLLPESDCFTKIKTALKMPAEGKRRLFFFDWQAVAEQKRAFRIMAPSRQGPVTAGIAVETAVPAGAVDAEIDTRQASTFATLAGISAIRKREPESAPQELRVDAAGRADAEGGEVDRFGAGTEFQPFSSGQPGQGDRERRHPGSRLFLGQSTEVR